MAGPNPEEAEAIYQSSLITNDAIDISGYSDPRTFAEAEAFADALLGLNQFGRFSTITGNSTRRPAGIRAYITQVDNVITELGRQGKLSSFILSQTALHILNPAVSVPPGLQRQIVNPLTILTGPPPFFGGLTTDSIVPPVAVLNPVTNNNEDTLKQLYDGNKVDIQPVAGIPPVNIQGPKSRYPSDDGSGLEASAGEAIAQVTGVDLSGLGGITFDQKAKELNLMDKGAAGRKSETTFDNTTIFEAAGNSSIGMTTDQNASQRARFVNDGIQRPNLAALFDLPASTRVGPNFDRGVRGHGYSAVKRDAIGPLSDVSRAQRAAQRNIDSFMGPATRTFEQNNGYLNTRISDFDAVVPFYFQDLREPSRFLYFKAFLVGLGEDIAPEWNKERFYGRVDPVGTYMNTTRTFGVSFMVVAMSQEGLTTMWRKINSLCKMVYPTFDEENVMSKAPVIRLRIGDLCADEGGQGLPGFIENLSFDYTNTPWEILPFVGGGTELELGIVPMWANISFQFQVIHETTPKVDVNYNFATRHFRRMGSLRAETAATTDAGSQQTKSTLERDQTQAGATPPSSDTGIPS